LQDLKILQVCVFGIHIKLDSRHWDIEVNAIEDLAESRTALLSAGWQREVQEKAAVGQDTNLPSSTLFDLGYI
jgi:hypothetical protein